MTPPLDTGTDPRPATGREYLCGECGKLVPDATTYHPWLACLIFKSTGRDPLPYLEDVGRYYRDYPEKLPKRPQELAR